MKPETKKRLGELCEMIVTIALGVILVASCMIIYNDGHFPTLNDYSGMFTW